MDYQTILECQHLSAESRITFPEAVQRLLAADVDSYDVDLIKKRVVYYDAYDQSLDIAFSVDDLPPVSDVFNAEAVAQAVKRSQRREIDYPAFIREVMKAGVCLYTAYLTGRRVVYTGLNGQSHTEEFPPAPPKHS
jgi:uncharacterized protein YbcV (DUF1398 family)